MSWLHEGYAELFALSNLGANDYYECREQAVALQGDNIIRRALHPLLYPPPTLVVWVANRRAD